MAILSNGKFYGFLCSAKETGQKLANGVKEYVEDFVSGFAGHGWKIWEYVKGKWMLEIDSIRVRGQFTVFEMLISKVRAIIGAQAITQGCGKIKTAELSEDGTAYLITLEDADMSFMEHDFIRCQEFTGGQKVYHVEIESVADGIIRVPLSEFDLDEEGITLNPPAPGDDIVQFGNSSHDEKYVGRHSAIYMHANEGLQPAIDVLDEIYSKDWSDCLKARFGGDIPGGDGTRGFYSVNGMIKGVDKSGHTVYCLYPDGTAELGDKSALFKPDKSGYIAGGAIAWEWSEEKQKHVILMDDVLVEWKNLKNSLEWINDWTGCGTTIGNKFVAAPTGFFGKHDKETGELTGILMGDKVMVDGIERTGIFALVDNKPVFELDPLTKKYKFDGEIYSTKGVIGGFDIGEYGIKNTDGKRAIIDVHTTSSSTDRRAALGNTLSSIVGFDVSAYMSATGNQYSENKALMLRASGSTMKHGIWGGNCNFCIDAIGGVNWRMNKGDHWCMPGVLGYVYLETWYNNGKPILTSNYWGDGVRFYSIGVEQASANDGHNFVILKYYSKHDRIYCLPQNMGYDWNGTGKFELIPVVESTYETVDATSNLRQMRITFWWRGGGKYIPNKSLYVLIGEPSD